MECSSGDGVNDGIVATGEKRGGSADSIQPGDGAGGFIGVGVLKIKGQRSRRQGRGNVRPFPARLKKFIKIRIHNGDGNCGKQGADFQCFDCRAVQCMALLIFLGLGPGLRGIVKKTGMEKGELIFLLLGRGIGPD